MKSLLSHRITTIHAFLSINEDDVEGVIAKMDPRGVWVPLIASDETRLGLIRELAQEIATRTKCKIRHVKFSAREEIEELGP